MGHQRLGRLKRTRRWLQVVELLGQTAEVSTVAAATTAAADQRLAKLASDNSLSYSVWLLTRVTWAARGESFLSDLADLGIDAGNTTSALSLVIRITDHARKALGDSPESGHVREICSLALRSALSETVGAQGPSFFDSDIEASQRAFRAYSSAARFGELARRFFAAFMSRTLRGLVDRELSNQVGTVGLPTARNSSEFLDALNLHAWEASRIVEDFAGGWYSRHNWESQGRISQDEARRFAAQAMRKFRAELKQGAPA